MSHICTLCAVLNWQSLRLCVSYSEIPYIWIAIFTHIQDSPAHKTSIFITFPSKEVQTVLTLYVIAKGTSIFHVMNLEKIHAPYRGKCSICYASLFYDQLSYVCITAFEKRPGSLTWKLWAPIVKVLCVRMSELFANFYSCFFVLHLFGSQNYFLQYFDQQVSIVLWNLC